MLDQRYFENGHLSQTALDALAMGTLSPHGTHLLLIHLEHCPSCMDAYIATLDTVPLEQPPEDLEQHILEQVEQVSHSRNSSSVAIGFLKLAVAVCLTMLLFFANVFDRVFTSSEHLAQYLAVASEASGENQWAAFASGFQQGFSDLINRFNDLFNGDASNNETQTATPS